MQVEVFYLGHSMGKVTFKNWKDFEKYVLRWLTKPVKIQIYFEDLQEQLMWYSEINDLIYCTQKAQDDQILNQWKVKLFHYSDSLLLVIQE